MRRRRIARELLFFTLAAFAGLTRATAHLYPISRRIGYNRVSAPVGKRVADLDTTDLPPSLFVALATACVRVDIRVVYVCVLSARALV